MDQASAPSGKLVKWKLEELHPGEGDLLSTLDKWFDVQPQNGDHPLREFYRYGLRLHKGQLAYWRRRDRAKGTRWESRAVSRLFAVRAAVIAKGCELYEASGIRTIEMMQCQPSGGIWTKDRPGTGWRCRTWLCPWCYLRRLEELRKLLRFDRDRLVEQSGVPSEYERIPGLGFGEKVNVTLCRHVETWTPEGTILQPFSLGNFIATTDAFVRRKAFPASQRPPLEFDEAMRFLTPVMERPFQGRQDEKVKNPLPVQPCTVGWQMGYIHTKSFDGLAKSLSICGTTIEVTRHEGLTPEEALRLANPWPMRWINLPTELVKQVDTALNGRKRYGVLRLTEKVPPLFPLPNPRQIPATTMEQAAVA